MNERLQSDEWCDARTDMLAGRADI